MSIEGNVFINFKLKPLAVHIGITRKIFRMYIKSSISRPATKGARGAKP